MPQRESVSIPTSLLYDNVSRLLPVQLGHHHFPRELRGRRGTERCDRPRSRLVRSEGALPARGGGRAAAGRRRGQVGRRGGPSDRSLWRGGGLSVEASCFLKMQMKLFTKVFES